MESSKARSDVFNQLMSDNNSKLLSVHKESITTIILGLDILEYLNESQNNKELVQIIRHSFEKLLESFFEDEKMDNMNPP
jgi:hypothetical protein